MPLRVADPRLWSNLPGVVAAYQSIGAPDALTARQNMALGGRGRYAAAPGTAPTWALRVGWTFNGTDQWLSTGVVLTNDQSWSFLLRYSGASARDRAIALSRTGAGTTDFGVYVSDYIATYVYNGSYLLVSHSSITGGVWAITGNGVYLNGAAVTGTISSGSGTATVAFPLGAMDDDGARSLWYAGNIQSAAIYNRKLTADEVWLASQQMAYCDAVADYSVWAPARRWFFITPPVPAAATPVLSTIYINTADIGDMSLFDDVSGVAVSASYARTGAKSFKLAIGAYLQADLTSSATKYTKFGLLVTDTPASDALLVAWQETGTEHVSLYLTDKLTLQMQQGSTIIQTSPTTLETETWYCIETKIVVHDTVGRFQVRIDGVDDMAAIGINTDDDVSGTINEIRFEAPVDDTYIDDIVVREDQWCGTGGVYVVVPAAGGTYSEWTGAYSSVDELPPSFTDYISAATTGGNESTFRHSGLTTDYSQIPVVGVFAKSRLDAAADVAAYAAAYSNEEFATGDAQSLDETGVYARLLMTINPDGSAVWTTATVDALEIGIKA